MHLIRHHSLRLGCRLPGADPRPQREHAVRLSTSSVRKSRRHCSCSCGFEKGARLHDSDISQVLARDWVQTPSQPLPPSFCRCIRRPLSARPRQPSRTAIGIRTAALTPQHGTRESASVPTAINHVPLSVGRSTLSPRLHSRAAAPLGREARQAAERPASKTEPAAIPPHALVASKLDRARLNDTTRSLQSPTSAASVLRVRRSRPGITSRGVATIGALVVLWKSWNPKMICCTSHLSHPPGLLRDKAGQVQDGFTTAGRHARASSKSLGQPIRLRIPCAIEGGKQRPIAKGGDTDVALRRVRRHPDEIHIILCISRRAQGRPDVG